MLKNQVKGLAHFGLPTAKFDETLRFYETLGFKNVYQTVNGKNRVAFLELYNVQVETYEEDIVAGKAGSIDHIALTVDSVEETYEILKKEGFKLLDDKINFLPFWSNGTNFFTIEGPNGEKIEFCKKNEQ